jgi:hypothetical protein
MAVLTTKARKNLPKSDFGLPGSRKFPMPDRAHAANAKARASQQVAKGNLSPASKAKIDAKANRILGKSSDAMPKAKRNPLHKTPKPMGATRQVNKFFSS